MARFFIDRPIFAWVIAIVIMLSGALSLLSLPVSQYPAIAPPAIAIQANYPGASAKAVEDAVTQVIEQKMTGLDGLLSMSSTSDAYGRATVTLSFDAGTNPDMAQVQVQNKLQLALPLLPQAVQQQGVQVAKSARNFLMVVGFVSEDGQQTAVDLSDFLVSRVQEPLSRVAGVGEVQIFGSQYAMRIWLDPLALKRYGLTPGDVRQALLTQNTQVSAGELGGLPAVPGQGFSASLVAQTRLTDVAAFENILIQSSPEGGHVFLRDLARVERGAEQYGTVARYNGQPAAGLGIRLAAGANALETAKAVRARLAAMEADFPPNVKAVIPYDTTPFVEISIQEVVKTLVEAVILVFLVMFLFLQNFRATLIPTIAVPVVLLGTLGIMAALGFSINTLTLFGMVLAIGLLVDDAIVVVENVERVMTEEGLSPREAARKSMDQITSALIGIGLVLSAVFVPMAFFPGSTGVIYRQFSVTIVSAMALSVLVAIVFTPALCATLLKPVAKGHEIGEGSWFFGFFRAFNRGFNRGNARYESLVSRILGRTKRFVAIYLAILVAMGWLFAQMPTSFLPDEDQGVLFSQVMLPAGATQERTVAVLKKLNDHFMENEKETVRAVFTVAGFSFGGSGQNMGIAFVNLRHWDERPRPDQHVRAVAQRAMGAFAQIREAMVFAFVPPAVIELGTANGFNVQLQDRAGLGHEALMQARGQFLGIAMQTPGLVAVRPNGQGDVPQYRLEMDMAKAQSMGLTVSDINETLSIAWGGAYINDFIDRGRVKKVFLQAQAEARMNPEDLDAWFVRNKAGQMVPLSAFTQGHWQYGSPRLERYNGLPSVELTGQGVPGLSSGDVMAKVEAIIQQLPPGIGYEWSGMSFEERRSGAQAPALYVLSLLVVFLCLAALYESWSVPFSVMLVVPLGIVGALVAATGRGLSNDVYFQVALLATMGLSSKNAILIVEFARARVAEGQAVVHATLEAVRLRLRPILMTSMAFGLGVLPLAISQGAGSGSRNAIGTGVLGGTIAGTLLGLFFVPLFYVLVKRAFPDSLPAKEGTEATK
jgi:multidrug efflux pump